MIFSNYREIVNPEDADWYWKIFPPAPADNILPWHKRQPENTKNDLTPERLHGRFFHVIDSILKPSFNFLRKHPSLNRVF
jgi:hypothetical protein